MGLGDLLGGQGGKQIQDFVSRFEGGNSREDGFDDDEAASQHDQVAGQLSDDEYRDSARESVERLSPDERRELGEQVRGRAESQGVQVGGDPSRDTDPGGLADLLTMVQRQVPGGLGGILKGLGGSGSNSGGLGKLALGGVAAMAAKKFMSGR